MLGGNAIQRQDEMMRPTIMEKDDIKVTSALDLEESYKGRNVIVTGGGGLVGEEVVNSLLKK